MKWGTTISERQLRHLGLDLEQAWDGVLNLGFSYVRLGVYWSEIEVSPGHYQFERLHQLLQLCQQRQQNVVLTVGVKAPRWPEFYWPDFITEKNIESQLTKQAALRFIQVVVEQVKTYSCISHWQVENEPLDSVGADFQKITIDFLRQEVALVQELDQRPIVLTAWGNDLIGRRTLPALAPLTDVIGIDLYYRQYMTSILGTPVYAGPRNSHQQLSAELKKCNKPVWVSELQAEPWEKDDAMYLADQPPSFNLPYLQQFIAEVRKLPVEAVFLWGAEYWLYRREQGDSSYWEYVKSIIDNEKQHKAV